MLSRLKNCGRICIITFHPLEDRIVKQAFKLHSTNCICPPRIPKCVCNHKADIKLITKHPIVPSEAELISNSRSASAKLRIAEKLQVNKMETEKETSANITFDTEQKKYTENENNQD